MVLMGSGCRREDRRPSVGDAANKSVPAESLAASFGNGVEVWFTLAREAQGNDGRQCQERGLEIRRGGSRVPVPLLYTGETPISLNDSTMRAVLWNQCQPVATYLVDLRTGRPVRERMGHN
jgi:hypothetical protein